MNVPDLTGSTQLSQLSNEEIELRQRWLEFETIKSSEIDQIDSLIKMHVDELMDSMYEHFLSFEETRSFFPSPQVMERAKAAQKQYFLRLARGVYDSNYVADRLRVGSTHHRIELDPKWYIGAYNRAVAWLLPRLFSEGAKDETAKKVDVATSLMKLIFFDMGLAIESYIGSKELAIIQHRDAIRELETEKRVTKSILESAPIGIVSLDDSFLCVECNEEFAQLLSLTSTKDVLGKNLFDLAPLLSKQAFQACKETGNPSQVSAEALNFLMDKTSEITYWDWAIWPVKRGDGSTSGMVAMFSNATDRVMLQQQREDFVATLTHDLKTPVSATNRAIKLLLDGDFGELQAGQREILETILQSNTTLYGLVQTLLDVYRFDSGVKEMDIKECNLAAVITQLVTEIMPLAQERRVQLRAVLPVDANPIDCDQEEVRRVIQNLIDNSLKFTPPSGTVTVSMTQTEANTTVFVKDTGKGIPTENMSKMFQRFWQAGSSGRYYASTGLGLYLARKIVEGHGGKIWCESVVGQGSTFFFVVPNHKQSKQNQTV
ncbi:MAG TPA: protoglobin domain-containing protein [Candidatus Melainabacteria bacterium]|nr:protoglobin domain-containing protein [Candidatus Melainabacteria bacterium]